MNRTHRARLERRRATLLGVGLSFVIHAGVLALVRIDVQALPERPRVFFEADDADPLEIARAIEVVSFPRDMRAPAPRTMDPASEAGAAAAPAPAAGLPANAAPRPLPGSPLLPASASPAEQTWDELVVVDPLRNVQDEPVAITDLPAAEATPERGDAPDAVEVYEPGSVGRAKRQWAAAGAGVAEKGVKSWTIGFAGGGGHCPMPGRGGTRPGPFWNNAI
jgi:hypothetical protein